MDFKTIVTIGPASLRRETLEEIDRQGSCIYRINGAHVSEGQVVEQVEFIRSIFPGAKIALDIPGNKIRTAGLREPVKLVKGQSFFLHADQVNYPFFIDYLKEGDTILANDSIYTLEVIEKDRHRIKLLSHSDGFLASNKGLHVRGIHENIPFLFDKDRMLIEKARAYSLDFLSVSFVRTAGDIRMVKEIINGRDVHIIAKIETKAAIQNLDSILDEVESVLVDRGDLSTEMDILDLYDAQEKIIKRALEAEKNIYLATQFLKNMERYPVPLIAEVIDLSRTIKSGISGIQLSEETAIGKYPVECVKLVFDAVKQSRAFKKRTELGGIYVSSN